MTYPSREIVEQSAQMAHSITRRASLLTYLIIRWMVDKSRVDDCYRAYAYFRWLDNYIDDGSIRVDQKRAMLQQQIALLRTVTAKEAVSGASQWEQMLVDLVTQNREKNQYLTQYIQNFFSMLEFDLNRRDQLITEADLVWYSKTIGHAVTCAIFFFIGQDCEYPDHDDMFLAPIASHITHMLRDYRQDLTEGYFNIPKEYVDRHQIQLEDTSSESFRGWVKDRVKLARAYFRRGKTAILTVPVLRTKIVGYWYATSFEQVLDFIELDRFQLREEYPRPRMVVMLVQMIKMAVKVTWNHLLSRVRRRRL